MSRFPLDPVISNLSAAPGLFKAVQDSFGQTGGHKYLILVERENKFYLSIGQKEESISFLKICSIVDQILKLSRWEPSQINEIKESLSTIQTHFDKKYSNRFFRWWYVIPQQLKKGSYCLFNLKMLEQVLTIKKKVEKLVPKESTALMLVHQQEKITHTFPLGNLTLEKGKKVDSNTLSLINSDLFFSLLKHILIERGIETEEMEKAYKKLLLEELIVKGVLSSEAKIKSLPSLMSPLKPSQLGVSVQQLLDTTESYIKGMNIYDLMDQFLAQYKGRYESFNGVFKAYHQITLVDILKRELFDPLQMTRANVQKPSDSNVLFPVRGMGDLETNQFLWISMEDLAKFVGAFTSDGLFTKSKSPLLSKRGLANFLMDSGGILESKGKCSSSGFLLKMDLANGKALGILSNFCDKKTFEEIEKLL